MERTASTDLCVVKLGGSVITNKSAENEVNQANLKRVIEEIASSNKRVIIVHGGGGFGHTMAKRYKVSEGYPSSTVYGASATMNAMSELNRIVCEVMVENGLPPLSLPPHSIMTLKKRISPQALRLAEFGLKHGFVPVSYGDVYFEPKRIFSIVSGDLIAAQFAVKLRARSLVYATASPGVYTRFPPADSDKPLKEVDQATDFIATSSDVTGGMAYKVQQGLNAARNGCRCIIIDATIPGRLAEVLRGEQFTGTEVVWRKSPNPHGKLK